MKINTYTKRILTSKQNQNLGITLTYQEADSIIIKVFELKICLIKADKYFGFHLKESNAFQALNFDVSNNNLQIGNKILIITYKKSLRRCYNQLRYSVYTRLIQIPKIPTILEQTKFLCSMNCNFNLYKIILNYILNLIIYEITLLQNNSCYRMYKEWVGICFAA